MPQRNYFLTIDFNGNLIHEGVILEDSAFLDTFFKYLQHNDSGEFSDYPYVSLCGSEKNFVAVADTPIVFKHLEYDKLWYSPSNFVPFNPQELRYGDNGVLYHSSSIGRWGRVVPKVIVELSKNIEHWGDWFGYRCNSNRLLEVIPPLNLVVNKQVLRPRIGNACAGCGKDNPNSLLLSFVFDSTTNQVESWYKPDTSLMGALNIMHGGYAALLLDETMGKVLSGLQVKAPTAQLNVKYRNPIKISEQLYLTANVTKHEGRKYHLYGRICYANDVNTILTEAEALFIAIKTA